MHPNSLSNLRPTGRPPGVKNKKVINTETLINLLNQYDYDPVVDQINLARDPNTSDGTRAKINMEFMKLLYPSVKAVQHSGSVEHTSMNISMHVQEPVAIEHEQTIDASVDMSVMPSISVDDESDRP